MSSEDNVDLCKVSKGARDVCEQKADDTSFFVVDLWWTLFLEGYTVLCGLGVLLAGQDTEQEKFEVINLETVYYPSCIAIGNLDGLDAKDW